MEYFHVSLLEKIKFLTQIGQLQTNMFIIDYLSVSLLWYFEIFSKTKVSRYLERKTPKEVCCRVDFCGSPPL